MAPKAFDVDHRQASSLVEGLRAHRREHRPGRVLATEPASWDGFDMLHPA